MAATAILIVDDHPLFADGFSHMACGLRPEWEIHVATSASHAMSMLRVLTLDIVIVDIGLPDDDGFGLLRSIHAAWPGLPTILISGRVDAGVRARARASSASGFIAKTTTPQIVIEMIETVLSGRQAFCDDSDAIAVPTLTIRQAEVLALLAEGHANKEIRHRLGIAERTVRAHLTELFHLLGVNSRMQAVIRGRELGLIES